MNDCEMNDGNKMCGRLAKLRERRGIERVRRLGDRRKKIMVQVIVLGGCDAFVTGLHEPCEGPVEQVHGTGQGGDR